MSAKTDVTSTRIASRNFSFDNKEIVSAKNRRVSLCVSDTFEHEPTLLETRRASSPFTNGGTELLIGPHDECRLKTTAIVEGSRRSQRDFSNRWVPIFIFPKILNFRYDETKFCFLLHYYCSDACQKIPAQ